MLFEILVRKKGRVSQVGLWVAVLKTVGGNTRVSSSLTSSATLPPRITVSTRSFGLRGSGSIPLGVTKMVIWSSGLGAGLQNLLRGFESYYHLNGFGGNPRIDDESMSTKTTEWSGTEDGSYLTLEWFNTITRYNTGSHLTVKYGSVVI